MNSVTLKSLKSELQDFRSETSTRFDLLASQIAHNTDSISGLKSDVAVLKTDVAGLKTGQDSLKELLLNEIRAMGVRYEAQEENMKLLIEGFKYHGQRLDRVEKHVGLT